jgi:hypothetical protein
MVDDTCSRCGGSFHCGVNDAAPCACTTIELTARVLADLRERYAVCVCLGCLTELAAREKAGPISRPAGFQE